MHTNTLNLTEGPIFTKVVRYSLPLLGMFVLQLLFNAVDMLVVGRFASSTALAAVGATTNLYHLLVNLLVGTSVGVSVVAANYFGAGNIRKLNETIHTSMLFALIAGIVFGIICFFLAEPLLRMMNTPQEVIDKSSLYIKICFAGLPFMQVYNFGSAILRAVGDTWRPMLYLIVAGVANIFLNLFFVVVLKHDVDGVATATVISNAISSILVWQAIPKTGSGIRLEFKELRINPAILKNVLVIGVAAGIQGACFSFSNVIIQSSINSFGAMAVAGCTAALILEGIAYAGSYSYQQTAISFVGQNYGARKRDTIIRSFWWCMLLGTLIPGFMGLVFYSFGRPLLGIFIPESEVIEFGMQRVRIVMLTYALIGPLDTLSGALRGLGRSVINTCIMLVGVCGIRLIWIFFVFPYHRTITFLFGSYPVSWAITCIPMAIYLYVIVKRLDATQGRV